MPTVKQILTVRVSGKERKQKVRSLLLDLAHFRNMLLILIDKYYSLYREPLLNESVLYGLLAKTYRGDYKEQFNKVLENISKNSELSQLLGKLKAQKEKIDNVPFVQYITRQVVKDFKNFFKSLKSFKANPNKFRGAPRPPKPKKLSYLMNFSAEGNINTFKQEEDKLIIKNRKGKYLKIKLPRGFAYRVSSVRLKFFADDLYVDVVYDYVFQQKQPKGNYSVGIDIGLDEMISVVSENPEFKSFVVSGREIKAFNQWFNKEFAKLRSQIDYLKNEIRSQDYEDTKRLEKKLRELTIKSKALSACRKRWLDNNLHKLSRKLVDLLYETGHRILYVGRNALESKNGINLGSRLNQHFVSIPFRRLIQLIKYKAERLGMQVVEVDESYTSKTSPFVDIHQVQKTKDKSLCHGERKGNLFKDFILNKVFHADLVGALNILRVGAKLLKLNFYNNLKVLFAKLCNPKRFKLIEFLYLQVSRESLDYSLGIAGSRQGISVPAGWTGKTGLLV